MYVSALPDEVKSLNLLQIMHKNKTKCIDFYMHTFSATHLLITLAAGC